MLGNRLVVAVVFASKERTLSGGVSMLNSFVALLASVAVVPTVADRPPAAPTVAAPALDPGHRVAAERFVDLVMPSGFMQRALGAGGGFGMESMMDVRIGDFMPAAERPENFDPNLTFAEFMSARDPHFRERMRITSEVTNRITLEILTELEPEFRSTMAEMYGGRFTQAELEEMNRFFTTETGRKFAEIALTMMQDPVFQRMMSTMMPRMAAAAPRIALEVNAATAHLPPPSEEANEGQQNGEDGNN